MSDEDKFEKACSHFDKGEYFEAHEEWEDLWNEARGTRHAYLQGLIQAAVALHHASRQNWAGTRKLLASSMDYLKKGNGGGDEVDSVQLIELIIDFEIGLQKHLADEQIELPYFKLPRNR